MRRQEEREGKKERRKIDKQIKEDKRKRNEAIYLTQI
jgi:hypothetical protein